MERINDFDRVKLASRLDLVNAFLLRCLFYNVGPIGNDVSLSVIKGDKEDITEFPDQEIFDHCGFILIPTDFSDITKSNTEIPYGEVFKHLTNMEDPRYDEMQIRDLYVSTLKEMFPLVTM